MDGADEYYMINVQEMSNKALWKHCAAIKFNVDDYAMKVMEDRFVNAKDRMQH